MSVALSWGWRKFTGALETRIPQTEKKMRIRKAGIASRFCGLRRRGIANQCQFSKEFWVHHATSTG